MQLERNDLLGDQSNKYWLESTLAKVYSETKLRGVNKQRKEGKQREQGALKGKHLPSPPRPPSSLRLLFFLPALCLVQQGTRPLHFS